MAVYVDGLIDQTGFSNKWPYKYSCHLWADSLGELLDFAEELGLKQSWLHQSIVVPHFDITKNKRREAINLGAIPCTTEEAVHKWRKQGNKRKEDK